MVMKWMQNNKITMADIAFLFLFGAEFSYYLLILQTGIITYHHSHLSEIIMMPVGGIVGIALSTTQHRNRKRIFPTLLALQLFISLDYAQAGAFELFVLGIISGMTAPMLIYRIDKLWVAVSALGLSYSFGTTAFHIAASERMPIAVLLSIVAFGSALVADIQRTKKLSPHTTSLYTVGSIFLWLLLDAALFETLLRDGAMHLWGVSYFTWIIILFHSIGLAVAYLMRGWRYTDMTLVLLFVTAYSTYTTGDRLILSIVYPFVISYYNVTILYRLKSMRYLPLAIVSITLWTASGLGLMIALSHLFIVAWILLGILAGTVLFRSMNLKLPFNLITPTILKG